MKRLEEGDQLGRYRILKRLGSGAMGDVYLAEDPQIGRHVALKTVRVEDGRVKELDERKQRLLREARAAGRLLHPNIITLFDAGEDQGILYLAFEYVEGKDLADRASDGPPLSLGEALSIVRQASEGLDYAHRQGVIHRDIKPSNLMITADGRVKIADFGIARVADQTSDLTMTGSVVGSPHYMSPEQIRGEELDGRTDIFSLGVLLYEILCRRRPFEGETLTTLVYQILNQDPAPVATRRPDLAPRLQQLAARMLHKDRDQRFASAADVVREIVHCEREMAPQELAGSALRDDPPSDATVRMTDRPPTPPPAPSPAPAAAPPPPPPAAAAPAAGGAAARKSSSGARLAIIAAVVGVVLIGLVLVGLAARKFVAGRLAKAATAVVETEPDNRPPGTQTVPANVSTDPATRPGTEPRTESPTDPIAEEPPNSEPSPPVVEPEPRSDPQSDPQLEPGRRATQPQTPVEPRQQPPVEPRPTRPTPPPVDPTPRPVEPEPEPVPEPREDPRARRDAEVAAAQVNREMSTGMALSFDVQPKQAAEQVIVRLGRIVIGRPDEWNAKKRDGRAYAVPEPGLHLLTFLLDGAEVYRIRINAQPGGANPTTISVSLPQAGGRRRGN